MVCAGHAPGSGGVLRNTYDCIQWNPYADPALVDPASLCKWVQVVWSASRRLTMIQEALVSRIVLACVRDRITLQLERNLIICPLRIARARAWRSIGTQVTPARA